MSPALACHLDLCHLHFNIAPSALFLSLCSGLVFVFYYLFNTLLRVLLCSLSAYSWLISLLFPGFSHSFRRFALFSGSSDTTQPLSTTSQLKRCCFTSQALSQLTLFERCGALRLNERFFLMHLVRCGALGADHDHKDVNTIIMCSMYVSLLFYIEITNVDIIYVCKIFPVFYGPI